VRKALAGVLFVYFVVMSLYSIFRVKVLLVLGYTPTDLVIFNESLSTTIHGAGFFYNHIEGVSHFGVHNSPILLLILPLYKVWPSADLLLVLQTLSVTLAAVPFFKLSRLILKDENAAFAFTLLYLFSPFVLGVLRFDFHAVSLALPFIFLSLYYLEKGEYVKAFLVSLVVLLVREDAGLFPISVGLYLLALNYKRNARWAFLFGAAGVFWIGLSVFVVIPHFSHFHFYNRYTGRVLWRFVVYLVGVSLLSTGFLPLLAGRRLVLVLPAFLELALSNYWAMLTVGDHYQWLFGSLLLVVALYGARRLSERAFWGSVAVAGVFSLLFSPVFSPLFPHYLNAPYLLGSRIDATFKLARILLFR